jgi:hypothetical protein
MRIFTISLIIGLLLGSIIWLGRPAKIITQTYGVSYADRMAEYLELNTDELYTAILDDLGVRKIRLAAYWDEIQPEPEKYDFERLDYLIAEAGKRDAEVVLSVGRKLPRWPECFVPNWAKAENVNQDKALLEMVAVVIGRYENNPTVTTWQLENEPFVKWFGDCPPFSKKLLEAERVLVQSLSNKPIVVTDSGELSTWFRASHFGDQLGTTLYRVTWNHIFGYGVYPLPPSAYRLKARLWGLNPNDVVISELQAEPWPPGTGLMETEISEQLRSMDINRFNEQIEFAKRTGFKESWFWGVEWWYWMKQNGYPEFWERGKEVFRN